MELVLPHHSGCACHQGFIRGAPVEGDLWRTICPIPATCATVDTWIKIAHKASMMQYDAIIVGSGPNGLSAAIVLAQAGPSVLVVESRDTIGGGTRSKELTLPGFIHDVFSAIHPLGYGSPFFRTLPLEEYGL